MKRKILNTIYLSVGIIVLLAVGRAIYYPSPEPFSGPVVNELPQSTHTPLESCSAYVRVQGLFLKSEWKMTILESDLIGPSTVIKKDTFGNKVSLILKDRTGWLEQTFHERTAEMYQVGDTVNVCLRITCAYCKWRGFLFQCEVDGGEVKCPECGEEDIIGQANPNEYE